MMFLKDAAEALAEVESLKSDPSHYVAHSHHFLGSNHVFHSLGNLLLDKSQNVLVGRHISVAVDRRTDICIDFALQYI